MARSQHVIIAMCLVLVTAGSVAGIGGAHPSDSTVTIEKTDAYTMSVDDNTVVISFEVTNTDLNRTVPNVTVTTTGDLSPLELRSNETVDVGRLEGGESDTVTFDVYVPAKTAEGNYTIPVAVHALQERQDNATGIVMVEYKSDSSSGSGGSDGDGEADSTSTSESSGAPAFVVEDGPDNWIEETLGVDIDPDEWFDFDFSLGSWISDLFS